MFHPSLITLVKTEGGPNLEHFALLVSQNRTTYGITGQHYTSKSDHTVILYITTFPCLM